MRTTVLYVLLLIVFTDAVYGQRFMEEIRETFDNYGKHVTKVVISSTTLADMSLRSAIEKGWKISPYEFCTIEEYEDIKTDDNYFFLMRVEGKYKKEFEPGLDYITLIRGGTEVRQGLYSSRNMISMPLQPVDDHSGSYLDLLPVYIDIFQNYIYSVQKDITLAFKGYAIYSDKVGKTLGKDILFSQDMLGFAANNDEMWNAFRGHIDMVSPEEIWEAIAVSRVNSVVPVVISPENAGSGSYCYKMLIDTGSHELLFYRKHKITKKFPSGFTKEDIKRIAVPYRL